MNNSEKKILINLLDMASYEFSNHGCNDYELENTDENWELILKIHDRCGEGRKQYMEDYGARPSGKLWTQDWLLMTYFSQTIKDELK